jgi:uncharacterized phage infection (PIP) family protein YhgE
LAQIDGPFNERKKMKKLIIVSCLLLFTSSVYGATLYKWVNKEGVVNFTEDYEKVPPIYRNTVEKINIGTEDTPKPDVPAASQAPLGKKEKATADIYGRDETWWRDKVRPWKEQLKQAKADYEAANKRYSERLEELSGKQQMSPTQHSMSTSELRSLKDEKTKYQAQIDEANEMLKKLSKEAEEAKANPDWLK